ncbi:uncharacterized protein PV07_03874 [Cladophialophora immunda]|uniref:Uncharacterized protein n=1 Tax=Cladophialophora immunda TaxID=569365 RepID=A0A0D2CQP6_9EURO|nr:uncharacterized protein PV07_03874 [Cladophialophora immunda]KIW32320.1 hypothetical protein PV07_03874 [Cladophialophora immunda]OQV07912.1 hypothetical protein CLAIMM_12266 [Cladophialophora immunda]
MEWDENTQDEHEYMENPDEEEQMGEEDYYETPLEEDEMYMHDGQGGYEDDEQMHQYHGAQGAADGSQHMGAQGHSASSGGGTGSNGMSANHSSKTPWPRPDSHIQQSQSHPQPTGGNQASTSPQSDAQIEKTVNSQLVSSLQRQGKSQAEINSVVNFANNPPGGAAG